MIKYFDLKTSNIYLYIFLQLIMHELAICRNLIAALKQHTLHLKKSKITKIYLEIGDLALVDKSSLLFNFLVLAKNTIAENAELIIENIIAKALCKNCRQVFILNSLFDCCEHCQQYYYTIMQGEELRIKFIEVESCAEPADVSNRIITMK